MFGRFQGWSVGKSCESVGNWAFGCWSRSRGREGRAASAILRQVLAGSLPP